LPQCPGRCTNRFESLVTLGGNWRGSVIMQGFRGVVMLLSFLDGSPASSLVVVVFFWMLNRFFPLILSSSPQGLFAYSHVILPLRLKSLQGIKASSSGRDDGCKVGHCGRRSRRHGSVRRWEHGSVDLRPQLFQNPAIHVTTCLSCAPLHLLLLDVLVNLRFYAFPMLICVATG
jgi:hypothetical protein